MNAKLTLTAILIFWGSFSVSSKDVSTDTSRMKLIFKLNQGGYLDITKNNLVAGVLFRAASISTLGFRNSQLQSGFLWSFSNPGRRGLDGWFISISSIFRIKKAYFEGSLFYRRNLFPATIHETNWGLTLGYNSRHFSIKLGNNYRIYQYTRKGIGEKGFDHETGNRLVEPRNMMYSLTYYIMPVDHKWNAALTITN